MGKIKFYSYFYGNLNIMTNIKRFKKLFSRFTNDVVVSWLFFFLLSQFGETPYETWELLIISGVFSTALFAFITVVIMLLKKDA